MLIKPEELQIGDEILIPRNGSFMYVKVLRLPRVSKKTLWGSDRIRYTAIKGTTKMDVITQTGLYNNTQTYTWTRNEFIVTAEDHNLTRNFDVNYKTLWLVKGEPR